MKERNHGIDLLCGLSILYVTMLHAISMCALNTTQWYTRLTAWTFFLVGIFFFEAGYSERETAGETLPYLRQRARNLLIPYVAWALIGGAVFFGFLRLFPEELKGYAKHVNWEHIWQAGYVYGNPSVWILLCLFVTYAAAHFMGKMRWLWVLALPCPLLSWWLAEKGNPLWMGLNSVFMGIFLYHLGRWWQRLQAVLSCGRFVGLSVLLTVLFVLGNQFLHGEYFMSQNKWTGCAWATPLSMSMALCGLSGLLMAVCRRRVPLLGFIGEHWKIFFLAHYPMIYYYNFVHATCGRSMRGHWNDFIVLVPIILGLCAWLVPYAERCSWLGGEKDERKNDPTI